MWQETTLLAAQVLLILGLAGLLVGWRHWRQRRDRRVGESLPPRAEVPLPSAAQVAGAPSMAAVKLTPMSPRLAPDPVVCLVPEELLLPGFADTCADWARQIVPDQDEEGDLTGFGLSDWSAPTDRIELDSGLDPDSLNWALAPLEQPEPADVLKVPAPPMSCTIAPQARHCA